MELRHLRYFLAVADTLHFGRAARRLHVSQPTVSQQIKQLEEELKTPLFERLDRGIRLTQAGELFRAHASRALEDVQAGQRALAALQGLQTGELRIGYLPSLTTGMVVPAISAVMRKYPGLRVIANEGVTRRVERRLVEGTLDVGLGLAPSRHLDIEAEPVLESPLTLVVPRRHPLAGSDKVTLRQLADEPIALLTRELRIRAWVDSFFARARFTPRVVFEANAVATVLAVVRAGLAISVLPEPRRAEIERLAVIPLTPAPRIQTAALFWRRGAPRSQAALAFAAEVRALGGGSPTSAGD